MRIAYLCHRVPYPPNKGCKLRAFHVLRVLSQRHQIHLLTLADREEDLAHRGKLLEICKEVEIFKLSSMASKVRGLLALPGKRPLTHAFFHHTGLWRRVGELAQSGEFDAVIGYSSSMAPFAASLRAPTRVVDLVDVDSAKWDQYAAKTSGPRSWVYGAEGRRLRSYEASLGETFDHLVVTTDRERDLMSEIAPDAPCSTVRNGIDLEYFTAPDVPRAEVPTLVFSGQMDYFANVDGIVSFEAAFRRLRERHPGLELYIVGRSPAPAVKALEQTPGIVVTGEVDDIRPFVARASVFVAPLRIAQGVQNKVLEALALGVPVVCSEAVMAGLADSGLRAGHDLLVGENDDELVAAVGRLLEDVDLRDQLGSRGRKTIAQIYSWERNVATLEDLLASHSEHTRAAAGLSAAQGAR